ncbi:MAG: hypothetical protein AB7E24_24385 [Novosphingobium sp.]
MSRLVSSLLWAVLTQVAQVANAQDFYWQVQGVDGQFASAMEACRARYPAPVVKSTYTQTLTGFRDDPGSNDPAYHECIIKNTSNSGAWEPYYTYIPLYRWGTSCPVDTEYDSETGECITANACDASIGPGIFKNSGPIIQSNGNNYVVTSGGGSVCYNSCSYTLADRASSCYFDVGSTTSGFCNYIGTPSGDGCSAPDAPLGSTGDPLNAPDAEDVPDSDPDDPGCSAIPGYVWSGTTCVKAPDEDSGSDGEGEGSDDGSGDGGSDGGSGGGDSGGGSDGGSDDGSGDGGGNNDGSGDGSGGDSDGEDGQCDPATDPNKCQGNVPGPGGALGEPEPGNWDEANAEWDQRLDEVKAELKAKVRENVNGMKAAFDLNLGGGSGQLPCETFTVFGRSMSLCVSAYSDTLSSLRYVLLLIAAVVAAFVILKD